VSVADCRCLRIRTRTQQRSSKHPRQGRSMRRWSGDADSRGPRYDSKRWCKRFNYPVLVCEQADVRSGWSREVTFGNGPSENLAGGNRDYSRLLVGTALHTAASHGRSALRGGSARITAIVIGTGRALWSDVTKQTCGYSPAGIPHSIKGWIRTGRTCMLFIREEL